MRAGVAASMLEALLAAVAACAGMRVRMLSLLPSAVRTCQVGVVRAAELSRSSAFRMRMYLVGGCAEVMGSENRAAS